MIHWCGQVDPYGGNAPRSTRKTHATTRRGSISYTSSGHALMGPAEMHGTSSIVPVSVAQRLSDAAADKSPVSGLTHNFYRYPARFSPAFAAAAIDSLSNPGDLILDPYMGGGTAVIEAMVGGRHVVGADLNSLAVFVARVKTTPLSAAEERSLAVWASNVVPVLSYRKPLGESKSLAEDRRTKNLGLTRARFIKKLVTLALVTVDHLPTQRSRNFAKCAILKTGQWALDGRKRHTSLGEFRAGLSQNVCEMLAGLREFGSRLRAVPNGCPRSRLIKTNAADIGNAPCFAKQHERAALVVTSPPYPGVHVLYHRWQVDGRRETPAPYWIAGCEDGQGASHYNFGDRRDSGQEAYFEASLRTLAAVRGVLRPGAYMVQMLAFSKPASQLPRYLANMERAGFREIRITWRGRGRIWRTVPNRKWYTNAKGTLGSAREVVLIHQAV